MALFSCGGRCVIGRSTYKETIKKRCTKCLDEKFLIEFANNKRYRFGVNAICKKCKNVVDSTWRRKKALANKSFCEREGCPNKCPLGRYTYCSDECSKKYHSKKVWEAQKNDPKYKEYHREVARRWAKEHYIPKHNGRATFYKRPLSATIKDIQAVLKEK